MDIQQLEKLFDDALYNGVIEVECSKCHTTIQGCVHSIDDLLLGQLSHPASKRPRAETDDGDFRPILAKSSASHSLSTSSVSSKL